MLLSKTMVERINIVMNALAKKYSLLSCLEFENDVLKFVVEYTYRRRNEIDDVFKDTIYFVFNKNITSYYHEWTGEDEFDVCKLVVNLKF